MAIPKIIHYCWFGGGSPPAIMKKCLRSWKKHCLDYEFVLWNEDNFDIASSEWTRQAYASEKYAFVSDYVRLMALKQYGGIYLDIDQELIKSPDAFLADSAFIGFMTDERVSTGVIGAEPSHPAIDRLFRYYRERPFIANGAQDLLPNTDWATSLLKEEGFTPGNRFQTLKNGLTVYPREYFCPTYCTRPENLRTKNTVAIHHFAMTWRTKKEIKSIIRTKRSRRKSAVIFKRLLRKPRAFLGRLATVCFFREKS